MAAENQQPTGSNPFASIESVRFIDLDQLSPSELNTWLDNLESTDPEAHAEISQIINRWSTRSPINI